jgi:hypothetical protein
VPDDIFGRGIVDKIPDSLHNGAFADIVGAGNHRYPGRELDTGGFMGHEIFKVDGFDHQIIFVILSLAKDLDSSVATLPQNDSYGNLS